MRQEFQSVHAKDAEGHPTGGMSYGEGISIRWQDGPLGRDGERVEPNGAFVETIIAIAIDRIRFYEDNGFGCDENRRAISHLEDAIQQLELRTARRELAKVEGTYEGT